MSKQSHIEQLIRELCPKGVTMCTLEKACANIYAGGTPLTSHPEYYDGDIPWLRSGEIDFNIITSTERNITQLGFEKSSARKVPAKSVLMAMTGATVAKVAITEIELTANQSVCALVPSSKLNYRYLYYYLSLQYDALRTTAQGAMTSFNLGIIKEIQIPLPPMPVQEEIVRILDAFTNLINNIEQEISERQKQFENAREQLFADVKDNWEEKALEDVGQLIKGSGILKSDFVEVGRPCIHYGQIHTHYKTSANEVIAYISEKLYAKCKKAQTGDLVIATTSEDVPACCKATAWLGKEDVAVSGDAHILHHNQDPLFMSYLFQTNLFSQQRALAAAGAKVTRVSGDKLKKFRFFFPPIEEQQAIAAKLDTIEAFIANLNEERTLRQQQYEYYRAKLISLLK